MHGFDVLDPHLNVKKNYFLEASAGTGKTFTIENLVVRLLQEGIEVDKILVVTFTRAATLELKLRIRKRLEEKKMHTALQAWEDAKIFTIHGFCFHTLKEHAFETGFSFSQNEESINPEDQKKILKDFLRTQLSVEEIHPRQLGKVLRKGGGSIEGLVHLLSHPYPVIGRSYREIQEKLRELLPITTLDAQELSAMASSFKGFCDRQGNVHPEYQNGFYRAMRLLQGDVEDISDLPLIKMAPENLKQKKTYPKSLDPLLKHLFPLLHEVSDTQLILGRLATRASQFLKHISEKNDLFFYEDFITKMQQNIHNPTFVKEVRSSYEAVLIDEFQDTDTVQWNIFSTLFLGHLPLYLVGDPKQSIYRFRGADLYTYLKAKEALGVGAYATLTRNFRSTPPLVDALNTLFKKAGDIIHLPKTNQSISIFPISAARDPQEEGKVIFCKSANEETLFSFIAAEIARLNRQEGIPYKECAILVKDRYQAKRLCAQFGLPFATQRTESLIESDAFFILEDLLLAVLNPRDRSLVIKVLGGALFDYTLENIDHALARISHKFSGNSNTLSTDLAPQIGEVVLHEHCPHLSEEQSQSPEVRFSPKICEKYGLESCLESFYRYHHTFVTKGILSFFQTIVEELSFPNKHIYLDMWQLVELIAENTTTNAECLSYLQKLKLEDPDTEILKARTKSTEDAVRIMTIHVSKGLEFEVVFPVGLISEGNMEDLEELSEKMRQLYVAMTRAKKYLYLPLGEKKDTPIQYFLSRVLKEDSLDHFIMTHPHFFQVECQLVSTSPTITSAPIFHAPSPNYNFSFPPCRIYSYSSLTANLSYDFSSATDYLGIPPGAETGIVLHKVLEKLDFSLRGEPLCTYLAHILQGTQLAPYLEQVKHMVLHTLYSQLPSPAGPFCLADIKACKMIREMEFLYSAPDGYLKGFIDLFFEHQGYYYCIDWKSNSLADYSQPSLEEAIRNHNYTLQASIYQNAVNKYLKLFREELRFAGSFYLFLRGVRAHSNEGIYFFNQENHGS